jgi:hypothetical protein
VSDGLVVWLLLDEKGILGAFSESAFGNFACSKLTSRRGVVDVTGSRVETDARFMGTGYRGSRGGLRGGWRTKIDRDEKRHAR